MSNSSDEDQVARPYSECPFASCEAEAEKRANHFRQLDPFPDIRPSLLSCQHVYDYVRVTAMLYPFDVQSDDGENRLKPASFEVLPGGNFYYWNEDGKKLVEEIGEKGSKKFTLPRNSITFIQIKPKIRLPDYMAIRFNLRITHVHRGLLLGTGPLVDPGFSGNLLIPLHNLTGQPYEIRYDEGLIWVEFTKTSFFDNDAGAVQGKFIQLPRRKTDVNPEVYFEKANSGNPIRSSIPQAVKDAGKKATEAAKSAARANRSAQFFTGIGFIAILAFVLGAAIGLHQYFGTMSALMSSSNSLATEVSERASSADENARRAYEESQGLRSELSAAQSRITELEEQLQTLSDDLETLRHRSQPSPSP